MISGTVLILDSEDQMKAGYDNLRAVYSADVVICGNKVLKNRWGKHGTIGEPFLEQRAEHTLEVLLDIWDKIIQGEREVGKIE